MKIQLMFINLACISLLVGCEIPGAQESKTQDPVDQLAKVQLFRPAVSPWTRLAGVASQSTLGAGVGIDSRLNCYVSGWTTGKLDPDRTGTIGGDVFVIKYDRNGIVQWIKQFGADEKISVCRGMAADRGGNSFVTGYTTGNVVAGSGDSTGYIDAFVAKYDNAGNKQWVRQLGIAEKGAWGFGIAIDSDGNSYATGVTDADLDGAGPGVKTGTKDFFIVKYDTDGNFVWVKQWGAPGKDAEGNAIAVDLEGNCYVVGDTYGDLDGAGPLVFSGGMDAFLAKLTTSGSMIVVGQWGTSAGATFGWGVAVDSAGNQFITGITPADLDGTGPGVVVGNADVYVMKIDASGIMQWVRQTSAPGQYAQGRGIGLDRAGNIYVGGDTSADIDGAGPGNLTGQSDIFVIKYDKNGTFSWAGQMGTPDHTISGMGMAVTPRGQCLVVGTVDTDFDGEMLVVDSLYDSFITTKLNEF